jgi:monofunctional glycosyltransferase
MGFIVDRLRYLKERAESTRLKLWRRVSKPAGSSRATDTMPAARGGFAARMRARLTAWHGPQEKPAEAARWKLWRRFMAPEAAAPAPAAPARPDGYGGVVRAKLAAWRAGHPRVSLAARILLIALAIFLLAPYVLVLAYRVVDPPVSALMVRRALGGRSIDYRWRDLDEIAPSLPRTVVISEDAALCRHWGVDWDAVGEAMDNAEEGEVPRGASTIPMQVAKNLFLWPGQSYLRKALEIPLAYFINLTWPKRRIVEVYVNIAEWGPGIFGAEAAARHHFRKSAANLTESESALLAASLPNPFVRHAGRPGPRVRNLAEHVMGRAEREGSAADCVFKRRPDND